MSLFWMDVDLFSNRMYHEHLLRETKVMQYYTFISEVRDLLIPSNAGHFSYNEGGHAYMYILKSLKKATL